MKIEAGIMPRIQKKNPLRCDCCGKFSNSLYPGGSEDDEWMEGECCASEATLFYFLDKG